MTTEDTRIFLRRQISVRVGEGELNELCDATVFPYKLSDVLPKYVLSLDGGKYNSDYLGLDSGDSYSVPLPKSYDSADKLHCCIRTNNTLKAVIVSPDEGTSTFLIKGTTGDTKGDHPGMLIWQGRVTSITISAPSALGNACLVDYFLFVIPDLDDPLSWRIGTQATGYVQTPGTP